MNNTAIAPVIESNNSNVVFLPTAGTNAESASKPNDAPDAGPSYGQNHCPPKEDSNKEGRLVGTFSNQQPVLEYRRKNYPLEYKRWDNMKQRCRCDGAFLDPRFEKFPDFMSHMGPMRHPKDSVDRINYDNPEYSPDNCRWASKKLQTANRRITRYLTDSTGLRRSVDEWSTRGPRIPAKTILRRVDVLGYSEHEAVHLPLFARRKRSPAPPTSDVNVKSTGSKSTQGMSLDGFDTLMERKAGVGNLYGKPAEVLMHLETVLREQYDLSFFNLEQKDVAIFWQCVDYWEPDLDAVKVFAHIFENWGGGASGFVAYACERGGFNAPTYPTLTFIKLNILAAGNFYADSVKEQEQEQRATASARQQEKLMEKRKEFVRDFVDADPKYRKAKKKLRKHVTKKDRPDCGMNAADISAYKKYRYHEESWALSMSIVWGVLEEVLKHRCIKAYQAANSWAEKAWDRKKVRCN